MPGALIANERYTSYRKRLAALWQGRNKPHYRRWKRPSQAGMAESDPASPRHDRGIQHVGEVDHRERRRTSIREQCECVVRGVGALIRSHRVGIKAIAKAAPNVARDPIGEQNNAGCRRKRNRRDGVAAKFPRHDSGMGSLRHRDAACSFVQERFGQRIQCRK